MTVVSGRAKRPCPRRHQAAVTTIRRAIQLLEDEGRVYTVPARGTFVGQAPAD